jgi:CDP-diacylglycerol--serine O-phosphatidyltransferase
VDLKRFLRYLAPNLVTATSLVFGMLSVKSSIDGHFAAAGWFVLLCVITDKADGFVARAVRGTSDLGVQLDSFADFMTFGVAPATLWYSYFKDAPELPFATGGGRLVLLASCTLWLLCVTFRLARYNIVNDDPKCRHLFFGVPTTFAACWLVAIFLTMLKYAEPGLAQHAAQHVDGELRLLGEVVTPRGLWLAFPAFIAVGGLLMASTLRIPKLGGGKRRPRLLTVFILGSVAIGYGLGILRLLPEVLAAITCVFFLLAAGWGVMSADARGLRAPPIFPRVDPPRGQEPKRPEEDFDEDDDDEADGETATVAQPGQSAH